MGDLFLFVTLGLAGVLSQSANPTRAAGSQIRANSLAVCIGSTPVSSPLQRVNVRVLGLESVRDASYAWQPTQGAVDGRGPAISWDLTNASLGVHTLRATASQGAEPIASCEVRVLLVPPGGTRGNGDLTARSYLLPESRERAGFGMYSYLLFGSQPTVASRPAYEAVAREYIRLMPRIEEFGPRFVDGVRRREMNVWYLPMKRSPSADGEATVDSILNHYDFARAKVLLSHLTGTQRGGPYLVSALGPLRDVSGPQEYLIQDLSAVPTQLVNQYFAAFLNQTAQENYGSAWLPQLWLLKVRTILVSLGTGLPEVSKAWDSWQSTFRTDSKP